MFIPHGPDWITVRASLISFKSNDNRPFAGLEHVKNDAAKSGRAYNESDGRGISHYVEETKQDGAWTYPDPVPEFAALLGHVAVYAGRVDRCLVDDEVVQPQPGDFYGGWVTSDVVGPFKGGLGTTSW